MAAPLTTGRSVVAFIELTGFYVAARVGTGNHRPQVVTSGGWVHDVCHLAWQAGLRPGNRSAALRLHCPEAVVQEYEAGPYRLRAQAVWQACLRHTPWVEPVAAHQVFLRLPHPDGPAGAACRHELADLLRRILPEHGFFARVGLAANKLVARAAVASGLPGTAGARLSDRKGAQPAPRWEFILVPPSREREFLAPLPVTALWPVRDWHRPLQQLGLRQVGAVADAGEAALVAQIGPVGRQIYLLSLGLDAEPVRPVYPPRQHSRAVRFAAAVADNVALEAALTRAAAALAQELRRQDEGCLAATLHTEWEGGQHRAETRRFNRLQYDPYALQQAFCSLLARCCRGRTPAAAVTELRAEVHELGPVTWRQLDLLAGADAGRLQQEKALQRALAALEARFPTRLVGLGMPVRSRREAMLTLVDPMRWAHAWKGGRIGGTPG